MNKYGIHSWMQFLQAMDKECFSVEKGLPPEHFSNEQGLLES